MYFPYFNMNALPTLIPKKYVRIEPTRFPNVPASTTLTGSNVPLLTRKPENGMIISLGIGMSALSKTRSEEHTSELQSQSNLVCRLLLEKKKEEHTSELQSQSNIRL